MSIAALFLARPVNENLLALIAPGAWLVVAINNHVEMPAWFNLSLLFLLNGAVWGAIAFGIWQRFVTRRINERAA